MHEISSRAVYDVTLNHGLVRGLPQPSHTLIFPGFQVLKSILLFI